VQFPFNAMEAIMALKNCTLHSYQGFAEMRNISVEEVTANCESDSGCTHKEKNKNKHIIMYNDSPNIPIERKIFTLAHELGHITLEHMVALENLEIYNSSYCDKSLEREANYFSATTLLPVPILSYIKPQTVSSIQMIFGLSHEAAEISFNDYKDYDKYYNIRWHNDILKLFDFQCDLLRNFTYKIDYIHKENHSQQQNSIQDF
jgi:Zn-dependent peptidase ImmA (M78 family)